MFRFLRDVYLFLFFVSFLLATFVYAMVAHTWVPVFLAFGGALALAWLLHPTGGHGEDK